MYCMYLYNLPSKSPSYRGRSNLLQTRSYSLRPNGPRCLEPTLRLWTLSVITIVALDGHILGIVYYGI